MSNASGRPTRRAFVCVFLWQSASYPQASGATPVENPLCRAHRVHGEPGGRRDAAQRTRRPGAVRLSIRSAPGEWHAEMGADLQRHRRDSRAAGFHRHRRGCREPRHRALTGEAPPSATAPPRGTCWGTCRRWRTGTRTNCPTGFTTRRAVPAVSPASGRP
ncbi:Hypothetical Protein RRSL_01658 [Ralstonia solanacearum UW551]|uniref:Secreted protein n=1 Tax=Ralstonia solanacearum (strain UW551) TaxID=342110 RepID=A0AB33VAX6_RALSU|nr:Hypothetical Protein RRSL_01658 [Ralstonia solanacearum UW551]